jgi:hypothetical protein
MMGLILSGCGSAAPPTVPDATIPAQSPPLLSAAFDQQLARLEKANIAYDTPDNLQLGEPRIIKLLLSTQRSIPEIQATFETPEQTEGAEIEVSSRMRARLTGGGFIIQPLTEADRYISGVTETKWLWEISPIRTGIQTMRLTLEALIRVGDTETFQPIETYDRLIDVRVDEILKPLKEAKITFEPPEVVQFNEPSEVILRRYRQ